MSESPSAFKSLQRKARKEHKCCECSSTICVGAAYQYSSGIWDGEPASFKQCLACHNIMKKCSEYALRIDKWSGSPCFGELAEWFEGGWCIDYHGKEAADDMAKQLNVMPEVLYTLLQIT